MLPSIKITLLVLLVNRKSFLEYFSLGDNGSGDNNEDGGGSGHVCRGRYRGKRKREDEHVKLVHIPCEDKFYPYKAYNALKPGNRNYLQQLRHVRYQKDNDKDEKMQSIDRSLSIIAYVVDKVEVEKKPFHLIKLERLAIGLILHSPGLIRGRRRMVRTESLISVLNIVVLRFLNLSLRNQLIFN